MATFTFDGPNKRIQVDAEVGDSTFTAAEIYSAWKAWVVAGNAQYLEAFSESVGGNDLGAGSTLDSYIFLRNDLGWRIRPDARDHTLAINGNLFGAAAATPLFAATTAPAMVQINRSFSSRAIAVTSEGGDPTAIANAVWTHSTATDLTTKMTIAKAILQNKTITDPTTGLMTVFADDGVTPLLVAQLYEDILGLQIYQGQGANRRERLL